MKPEQQVEELTRGVVDLHVRAELVERLASGRPLRVKAGFDPTRPDLHLGHTVLLEKMRRFQELGHEVVLIIGDFTAQIGDPSGKSATRPVPTRQEIEEGARTYAEQAFRVLDRQRTRIVHNSEWLGAMRFDDVIRLAGKYRLARMMERDDFKKRWHEHASISLHELLYPLAQGYDSVVLECDVELGGTDQLFNLLVGRELMREYGKRPQIVMTTPILEGLSARLENGVLVGDKMSKSLDNYVGVAEPADEQYGKLMSIGDDLMWRYYQLLSTRASEDIAAMRAACASGARNPKTAKAELASEIVARFHGADEAKAAGARWEARFSRREVPTELAEVRVGAGESVPVAKALLAAGLVGSLSDARRLIEQGGLELDGQKVRDRNATLAPGGRYVVKAGKLKWAALLT